MSKDNHSTYIEQSLDMIDIGLISIDREGRIKLINKKAVNLFGFYPRVEFNHKRGRIEKGDVVIIADTALGKDDGNLKPEDLSVLGIDPSSIDIGQGFVLIGRFGDKSNGIIKKRSLESDRIEISKMFKCGMVTAAIDFMNSKIKINIGEIEFVQPYNRAFGQIVILDGKTLGVKFYQLRGYTARKEDIRYILYGKTYSSKGNNAEMLKLINANVFDLFPNSKMIKQFIKIANGVSENIKDIETTINGVYVRCTIAPIKSMKEIIGATLKIEDITKIKMLTRQRDEAWAFLQQLENDRLKDRKREEVLKGIIGISKSIRKVSEMVLKAGETSSNVLLIGESGTGKNLFANAIHQVSYWNHKPFVYINCAAIPENLFESELFGYSKGAFTGALPQGKAGKLEVADGGTVFLDEIAELSLSSQAKLLHFIQNRTFTRVGGVKPIVVDVRIISATNRKLEELIEEKKFREDLYYRINVMSIEIPPLRERREDIEYLIDYLMPKISKRLSLEEKKIDNDVVELLKSHNWKGNIRQLENTLEKMINISNKKTITLKDVPIEFLDVEKKDSLTIQEIVASMEIGQRKVKDMLQEIEKHLILKALNKTKYSRKDAMELLGMGKTNFYHKMKTYCINQSDVIE